MVRRVRLLQVRYEDLELPHGFMYWLTRLIASSSPQAKQAAYPAVERDLNLVVDEKVRWGDLAKVVREAASPFAERLEYRDLYRDAIAADSTYVEAQTGAGELFNAKYNYGDAAQYFADALEINPNSALAHLGVAQNKRIDGGEETSAALARALAINPNLVDALVLKADLELEERDYPRASADIEKAFRVNPHSLDAHRTRDRFCAR